MSHSELPGSLKWKHSPTTCPVYPRCPDVRAQIERLWRYETNLGLVKDQLAGTEAACRGE